MKVSIYAEVFILSIMIFFFGCSSRQRIICLGDSLTSGYLVDDKTYPKYLSKKVNAPIENLGEIGERSYSLLAKIPSVLEMKPTHIILEIGANDFFLHTDVKEFKRNLMEIIDLITHENVKVALILFFNDEIANSLAYVERDVLLDYKKAFIDCSKHFCIPLVEDIWGSAFFNSKYKTDKYHPN